MQKLMLTLLLLLVTELMKIMDAAAGETNDATPYRIGYYDQLS
jgi:hypothetical protein